MKLGEILQKERTNLDISIDEMAGAMGMIRENYTSYEKGDSDFEKWAPILAKIAIKLKVPTSRLISKSGKAGDTQKEKDQCGKRIKKIRENNGITIEDLAQKIGITAKELGSIEKGESVLEDIGPQLLYFAEKIKQPVFNLFSPGGLWYEEL